MLVLVILPNEREMEVNMAMVRTRRSRLCRKTFWPGLEVDLPRRMRQVRMGAREAEFTARLR